MKSCILYNADAGSAEYLQPMLDHCVQSIGCELRPIESGALSRGVRASVEEGFERLIVAGGDGTVSEAVNSLAPDFDRLELAVLPFGTGNDFARSLGIPLDEAGIRGYLRLDRPAVRVDIMSSDGDAPFYIANAANGGLGGSVAQTVDPEFKQRWGALAYWTSAFNTAMDYPIYRARIEADDAFLEEEIAAIAIANGRYVGGGFPVAPDALIDDGFLDVTIVPPLPVLELATSGLNFALNRSEFATSIRRFRARRVHVQSDPTLPFSIDGESETTLDATFEVVPRALRIIPGPLEPALTAFANVST